MKADYKKHTLQFKFEAGTSRGILTQRNTYFISIYRQENPLVAGIGEASPLEKLSVDDLPDFENIVQIYCAEFSQNPPDFSKNPQTSLEEGIYEYVQTLIPSKYPSLRFAFETALLDFYHGSKKIIFPSPFQEGKTAIQINGLIWMGKKEWMLEQISEKLEQGFHCLKMKIGAIDFEQECEILNSIRKKFSADKITLRVDANGAFDITQALDKLKKLSEYDLHSIEQPIKAGQIEEMKSLCANTPIPIALDEELIGVQGYDSKVALLKNIQPQYIILKATLVGGFQSAKEWIEIAESQKIQWWLTSALESNVGLNAISQFAATFPNLLPQGLGTGALYHNNIESPLSLENDLLKYDTEKNWGAISNYEL